MKVSVKPMSDADYQAQYDMETLMRAHEIEKDKKRFAAAKAMANRRLKEMSDMLGEEKKEGE